jgi:hypothetical protein
MRRKISTSEKQACFMDMTIMDRVDVDFPFLFFTLVFFLASNNRLLFFRGKQNGSSSLAPARSHRSISFKNSCLGRLPNQHSPFIRDSFQLVVEPVAVRIDNAVDWICVTRKHAI